jgi:hypothetical protein
MGAVMRIQTAEERSIHPANFGSLDDIADPINPILEKRAACTPESVYSFEVDVRIRDRAANSPKVPPITPIIKVLLIYSFVGGKNINYFSFYRKDGTYLFLYGDNQENTFIKRTRIAFIP